MWFCRAVRFDASLLVSNGKLNLFYCRCRTERTMDFSLIVPSYNEEGNLKRFLSEVTSCFRDADITYEVIFVDDGSSDSTLEVLKGLVRDTRAADETHPSDTEPLSTSSRQTVSVVSFSRNFGKEAALLAGLKQATGAYVGFIDADLQQDPAISLSMLQLLRESPGYDCVAAVQRERKDSVPLKFFKKAFYRLFNAMGEGIEITANASDFRVFKKVVAQALIDMPEYYRFSKGLFSWVGFNTHIITYEPKERFSGSSQWSFRKLFSYAIGGIASFSTLPLKITLYLGLITSLAAVVYLIFVVGEALFAGISVPGYPTLVCLILLFNGILMLVLGVFGEYLGRIYMEGKHRPLYITRETFSTQMGDEKKE